MLTEFREDRDRCPLENTTKRGSHDSTDWLYWKAEALRYKARAKRLRKSASKKLKRTKND
jgi:hypothetical protein